MSRIADAHARAGVTLPNEDVATWERERPFAEAHLEGIEPAVRAPSYRSLEPLPEPAHERKLDFDLNRVETPTPPAHERPEPAASPDAGVSELAAAVRRIFLSPKRKVRSVLFCTTPGDRITDVAWQAAEILASQSGKRVAFVEDGASKSVSPADGAHALVTRIGWYPDADANTDVGSGQADPGLGEHVSDLYSSFDFVIVNAAASRADDLVPLAREVDGVIILVAENETRLEAAETLVTTLRGSQAKLFGAILALRD